MIELVPTYEGTSHEVVRGELAGYQLFEDVTNWKNNYTFVALADLSLDERVRFAPRFADVWRALASSPRGYREGAPLARVTALLARANLLLVGSTDRRELGPASKLRLDGPYRVFEVGFVRTADDFFQLRATRGKEELVAISGAFNSFESQVADDPEEDYVQRRQLADRILRAATSGMVGGAQIALAFMMADVASAEAWEAHLASLEERAEPHRGLAEEVVRAIEASGDVVEVPTYGVARRTRLEARAIRSAESKDMLAAHVRVGGDTSLALPAEELFEVDVDEDAERPPAMPKELFGANRSPRARSRARALPFVLIAIALALIVFALARRAADRRWCAVDNRLLDVRGCFADEKACRASIPAMMSDHLACRRVERPWCFTYGGRFECFGSKPACDALDPRRGSCRRAWPAELAQ